MVDRNKKKTKINPYEVKIRKIPEGTYKEKIKGKKTNYFISLEKI